MRTRIITISGFLVFIGILFTFPDASHVRNFCYPDSLNQIESPFPFYLEGCNTWLRGPTYPIFVPLIIAGGLFLIFGLKNDRPSSLKKQVL